MALFTFKRRGMPLNVVLDGVPFRQGWSASVPLQRTRPVGTLRCQASDTLDSRAVPEPFLAFTPAWHGLHTWKVAQTTKTAPFTFKRRRAATL